MKRSIMLLFLPILISCILTPVRSQNTRDIIQKAMTDEIARNLERLQLEGLKKPFFISYTVRDVNTLFITSSLGSIVSSKENRSRRQQARVMVGDYTRNDENFQDMGGGYQSTMMESSGSLPLEDNYDGIRRTLWLATDNVYKQAAEQYERKQAAIAQQKLSAEEADLTDFSKAQRVVYSAPQRAFAMKKDQWEAFAKELSAQFREFPDIFSSKVTLFFYQADAYFTNTEGTQTAYPLTLAALQINASTQALDGEPLKDHLAYYGVTPEDIPKTDELKKAIKNMAGNLIALRNAPVLESTYTGPVLIEGQAVGELVAQRLFSGTSGLIASRKPIFSDPSVSMFYSQMKGGSFEDKIGTRILPREITISATPTLKNHDGQNLIGSFEVDAEGVNPPKKLTLVEEGTLKTLLNDRIPTPKVSESNGHARPVIGGYYPNCETAPGVISITASGGKTNSEMKKELLRKAKEEGLSYAIIVRKLTSPAAGGDDGFDVGSSSMSFRIRMEDVGSKVTNPILVYKVDVATGKEELLRSVELGGITANTLRRISATEKKPFVYNTLMSGGGGGGSFFPYIAFFMSGGGESISGIPASFIVPNSLLIDELEVKKEKRDYTPKLPVVPNPLSQK